MTQNKFSKKTNEEISKMIKRIGVSSIICGTMANIVLGNNYNNISYANDSTHQLKEFNYIEKEASALDPSIKNSLNDLMNLESYVDSSFEDTKNIDKDESLLSENNKSFLELSNNDYLQYLSGGGDVVTVHYKDNFDRLLVFDDIENQNVDDSDDDYHHHHSGWFIYPFIFNGGSYHSSSNGLVSNNMKNTSGVSTYNNRLTPQLKSNVRTLSKSTNSSLGKSQIKSTSTSQSKGLGSSMKSSVSRGGFGG